MIQRRTLHQDSWVAFPALLLSLFTCTQNIINIRHVYTWKRIQVEGGCEFKIQQLCLNSIKLKLPRSNVVRLTLLMLWIMVSLDGRHCDLLRELGFRVIQWLLQCLWSQRSYFSLWCTLAHSLKVTSCQGEISGLVYWTTARTGFQVFLGCLFTSSALPLKWQRKKHKFLCAQLLRGNIYCTILASLAGKQRWCGRKEPLLPIKCICRRASSGKVGVCLCVTDLSGHDKPFPEREVATAKQ